MPRQYVYPGINDLASQAPHAIVSMWHPTLNSISPDQVASASNTKFWWRCPKKHEWQSSPANLMRKGTCPVCTGRKCVAGVNDLGTTDQKVASQWHPEKNLTLKVQDVTRGSSRKAWWRCEQGHEWQAVVANRTLKGSGCPYCSGRRGILGQNDLVTTHPELFAECAPEFKELIASQGITAGSNLRVKWVCSNGHHWEAYLYSRLAGHGCPVCTNQKVVSGINDLLSRHPDIANQWHPTKNGSTQPSSVGACSAAYAWWQCKQGHEWRASIANRIAGSTACPACASQATTSRAEAEIVDFIRSLGVDVVTNNRQLIAPYEVDMFVPSRSVALEFNGLYWHSEARRSNLTYHYDKWKACHDKGIQLIHVWEDDWRFRQDIVKRMIAQKLSLANLPRIHARKTLIKDVPTDELRAFLDSNHIQGYVAGSFAWGLYDAENLVAVLVARWTNQDHRELSILRYATSAQVRGGFTKLLTHGERVSDVRSWVTFSDNSVSDGNLYVNNGFQQDGVLPPDYQYVVGQRRVHKFNYRLDRFKNDPSLTWVDGMTERELAALNGLKRIWDSGKVRYTKKVKRDDSQ